LFTGQQKVFEHGDEKNLHADEGKPLGLSGTKMGEVYTANASSLTPGYKARDRTLIAGDKRRPKDAKIEGYRHKLEDQCNQMKLSRRTLNDCLSIFDRVAASGPIAVQQVIPIILGILFYGCKQSDCPVTINELARQTGKSEPDIRKGMKIVAKRAPPSILPAKMDSSNLISRYCTQLGMSDPFLPQFISVAKEVDYKIRVFLEGKKPNTVAATDIILTLKWFHPSDTRWSVTDVARIANLTPATINKSIESVEKGMKEKMMTPESIVKYVNGLRGD